MNRVHLVARQDDPEAELGQTWVDHGRRMV